MEMLDESGEPNEESRAWYGAAEFLYWLLVCVVTRKSSGNLKYYCSRIYLDSTLETKGLELLYYTLRGNGVIEFTSRMLIQLLISIGRNVRKG